MKLLAVYMQQLQSRRGTHPGLILFYLTHNHFCKVAQHSAALRIKRALLAIDDTPTGQIHSRYKGTGLSNIHAILHTYR